MSDSQQIHNKSLFFALFRQKKKAKKRLVSWLFVYSLDKNPVRKINVKGNSEGNLQIKKDSDQIIVKSDLSGYSLEHTSREGNTSIADVTNLDSFKVSVDENDKLVVTQGDSDISDSNETNNPSVDEDDEDDYFDDIIKKIKAANDGDIIKININSKDRIPVAVINALKKKDNVTLVIRRNKGDNITLNSEMNFKDTKLSYYLISYLETLDDKIISSSTIEKENPNTGAAINHFANR